MRIHAGDIYVWHVPLLHRLVRALLFMPAVHRQVLNSCIRIRLHTVVFPRTSHIMCDAQDSVLGTDFSQTLQSKATNGLEADANEHKPVDSPPTQGMKHTDEPVSPECMVVLESLLLRKSINFIPIEPDVRFARARVFLVDGFFKVDVEEKLVSEGWAAINDKSFLDPMETHSWWDKFKRKRYLKRVGCGCSSSSSQQCIVVNCAA